MDEFLYVLSIISRYALPPILGGIIGLFTNWLAIKMLFLPYDPIYIGKFRLPFTPGIIPKRKSSIARAVGRAVSDEVLTQKELVNVFASENMKNGFIRSVKEFLYEGKTIGELTEGKDVSGAVSSVLADKIVHAVVMSDLEKIIASCGSSALKNQVKNPLLSFLISDSFIHSLSSDISVALKNYLYQNGRALLVPVISAEVDKYTEKNVGEALAEFRVTPEKAEQFLSLLYDKLTTSGLEKLLASADVATVVENKINAMDTKQVAKLTYKVMNKEMKAVVYLGGFLGAIIGTINIFI